MTTPGAVVIEVALDPPSVVVVETPPPTVDVLVAQQGVTGPQGIEGPQGIVGPVGPTGITIVNHGAVTTVARPVGAALVYWIGTARPDNALAYDLWYNA